MTELYRSRSGFHDITVDEQGGVVSLRFNGKLQSSLLTNGSLDSVQQYLDYLHLPLAMSPDASSVLVIGLGGGVLPLRMWHDYRRMRIDVVEIDPAVVEVSRRFFGLPDDDRLRVFVEDGRSYLERTREHYDVIVVDAYFETAMPFLLATREFVSLAASRLTGHGVLAYNLVGVLEGPGSESFRRFLAGVAAVLPDVLLSPVGVDCGGRRQNIILLASEASTSLDEVCDRVRSRVDGRVSVPGFESFADHLVRAKVLPDARPLTDSEAPADGLLRA